jgi:hypothetical protein
MIEQFVSDHLFGLIMGFAALLIMWFCAVSWVVIR